MACCASLRTGNTRAIQPGGRRASRRQADGSGTPMTTWPDDPRSTPDGNAVEFSYDALFRRRTKTTRAGVRRTAWVGDVPLDEDLPGGGRIKYVYDPTTEAPLAIEIGGEWHYVVRDGHGDVTELIRARDEQVVWSANPLGFETPIVVDDLAIPFPLRAVGQQFERKPASSTSERATTIPKKAAFSRPIRSDRLEAQTRMSTAESAAALGRSAGPGEPVSVTRRVCGDQDPSPESRQRIARTVGRDATSEVDPAVHRTFTSGRAASRGRCRRARRAGRPAVRHERNRGEPHQPVPSRSRRRSTPTSRSTIEDSVTNTNRRRTENR